jgi:hypothetical protein
VTFECASAMGRYYHGNELTGPDPAEIRIVV